LIRKIIIALFAVLAVFVGMLSLVLFTSTGLSIVTRVVPYLTGGTVTIERSGGRIADQWWLHGIKIQSGETTVTVKELRADWKFHELLQKNVQARVILFKEIEVILAQPDQNVEKQKAAPLELPIIGLPLAIIVDKLAVDGAVVRRIDTIQPLFILESLSLQIKARDDRLDIEELSLTTPEFDTSLAGALEFSENWPIEIKGKWSAKVENYAPVDGMITLSGNVSNPEFKVETHDPIEVDLEGKITSVFDVPTWQVHGEIEDINPNRLQAELPDMDVHAAIDTTGTIDNYQAHIVGTLDSSDYPQVNVDLKLSGTPFNLSIEPAIVSADASEARLTATIDWQQNLSWEARVDVAELDLSTFVDQPAGQVSLSVHSLGSYDNGHILYEIELEDFVGNIEKISQELLAEMKLTGDESGLKIISSNIGIGDGQASITGKLRWPDEFSWDTRIQLKSIDPSHIGATVEGLVDATVLSNGRVSESAVSGGVQLEQISGTLAGYELSGGGNFSYSDGDIIFENVFLNNGGNHLQIDGTIADTIDLTFSLDGSELNRILPSLQGILTADGTLKGTREYPGVTATIHGANLVYDDYKAGEIVADVAVSTQKSERIETTLSAEDVYIAGQQVSRISTALSGTVENHQLELSIDSSIGTITLSTDGSLIENSMWDGQIKTLRIDTSRFGKWQNKNDSSVQVSASSVTLEELCFGSQGVDFCGAGAWERGGEWSFNLSGLKFDLMALNRWQLANYRLNGSLEGGANVSANGLQLNSLAADVKLGELVLEAGENDYYEQLKWLDNSVSIDLDDSVLNVEVYSRFVDDSFIRGTLGINNFGDLTASLNTLPLEGKLEVAIKDLTPLTIVTAEYLEPSGNLSAKLDLAGSIGEPRLTGDITLGDGEIYIPQLNITPKNVNLSINGTGDSVAVNLETVSGEGTATAEGLFEFKQDGWAGNLKIVGNRVELMNQKEIELTADVDLLLKLGGDGGSLEGTLVIPEALIQPEEMTGSISESDDVRIIGEEEEAIGWPLDLAVKIELGDDVKVDGYGLSGNLKGSIDLANTEKEYLAGHGELYLDSGMISVYERQLKITRGRVLFDGGPVDNPGLDVSARKIIAAEELGKEDIIVGVNLIGSVDDFEMDLFSIPSMDDADIISYIVVGTSLRSSGEGEGGAVGAAISAIGKNKGNKILGTIGGAFAVDDLKIDGSGSDDTSLVVGKQLMDKLYISYDFNLYKNAGFFRIRYDFGKGFSVESNNSIDSNGLNLLYSFER